jgi:hypothetical protein
VQERALDKRAQPKHRVRRFTQHAAAHLVVGDRRKQVALVGVHGVERQLPRRLRMVLLQASQQGAPVVSRVGAVSD